MNRWEQNGSAIGRDAAAHAALGERRRGGEFVAPLGSSRSGRLVFASGASRIDVRADPSMEDLIRARFEGEAPRVAVRGGVVVVRSPRFSLFDRLPYRRERLGEVVLGTRVAWGVEIRGNASGTTADLRGLELRSYEVSVRSPNHGGASNRYGSTPTDGARNESIDIRRTALNRT